MLSERMSRALEQAAHDLKVDPAELERAVKAHLDSEPEAEDEKPYDPVKHGQEMAKRQTEGRAPDSLAWR
jgi:hypothetical protein